MSSVLMVVRPQREQDTPLTGEVIRFGDVSLSELAVAARTILDRRERDNWELGQVAAMAWALCGNAERAAAEGYAGDNQKERFGKWVSVNFTDTPQSSLYKARSLWQTFGHRREEVAHIPQSGLYLLAAPSVEESEREEILRTLSGQEGRIKVDDVSKAIKSLDKDEIHNHRAQGTGENEWYTPAHYVEEARAVLGGIDLDPASSDIAQQTIQASRHFTIDDNGLEQPWHGKVWMNPPYAQPAIRLFVEKLVAEHQAGRVSEAIALTHNYTDTAWFHHAALACSAICFTRGRIGFLDPDGNKAAPTQGQAFFYFGGRVDAFKSGFEQYGFVVVRHA